MRNETGATAVEYGLLAALVAGVVIGAVLLLGQSTQARFQDSCTQISSAMGSSCAP